MKEKKTGQEAFEDFYREIFGDRWAALRAALLEPAKPVPLETGLLKPYFSDRASQICARALEVEPGHRVLDLCAAPGGKTLVLALALEGRGDLTSNDRSSVRRARLHRVLEEHLPSDLRERVRVTGHDAARWGQKEPAAYDRILLDAPCSSERHVIQSDQHWNQWTPARTKSLALQSFAMLASALDALKPGGLLVYSTCALSPLENEENMEKLARKRRDLWEEDRRATDPGEEKKWGRILLPDREEGAGPLYYCRIRKKDSV